jgi:hypothetical protein
MLTGVITTSRSSYVSTGNRLRFTVGCTQTETGTCAGVTKRSDVPGRTRVNTSNRTGNWPQQHTGRHSPVGINRCETRHASHGVQHNDVVRLGPLVKSRVPCVGVAYFSRVLVAAVEGDVQATGRGLQAAFAEIRSVWVRLIRAVKRLQRKQ